MSLSSDRLFNDSAGSSSFPRNVLMLAATGDWVEQFGLLRPKIHSSIQIALHPICRQGRDTERLIRLGHGAARVIEIRIAVTVLEPRASILCAVTVIPSALSWRRNIPVKAA